MQVDGKATGDDTDGFSYMETLLVPNDVNSIEWNGLGRSNFKRFCVDQNNSVFQAVNGVLYTKKGYDRLGCAGRKHMIELVACPTLIEQHMVISGTKRIANCAFKGCKINSLILPEGLEEIGVNAFYMATKLNRIIIPKTIQRIEPQSHESFVQVIYDNNSFDSWQKFVAFLLSNGFELRSGNILRSL